MHCRHVCGLVLQGGGGHKTPVIILLRMGLVQLDKYKWQENQTAATNLGFVENSMMKLVFLKTNCEEIAKRGAEVTD